MKTMKKVVAMAIAMTMILGLCVINVSAANPPLEGFNIVFKNASGTVVTSADPGEKLTAEIILPNGDYTSAAVTLVPNKDAGIAFATEDMHKNASINYMVFNVPPATGNAQAKFAGGATISNAPYFTIDITVPSTAEKGTKLNLFSILKNSNAVTGSVTYVVPENSYGVDIKADEPEPKFGFDVVFKNSKGNVVTTAAPGEKLSAEIVLPNGTYTSAAVTLVPNKEAGVAFATEDMHKNPSISYIAFNVVAQTGNAQAKFAGGATIADAPYFTIDITVPSTAEEGDLNLFSILKNSNAVTGGVTHVIPNDSYGITVVDIPPVPPTEFNFDVVFKNADGDVVTSAKATTTVTAEIILPNANYKNAAVTLVPNKEAGVEFAAADMKKTDGIDYALFTVSPTGKAQAKVTSDFAIADVPYFTIDITIPADAELGDLDLFTILEGSGATCDISGTQALYDIAADAYGIEVLEGFIADSAEYTDGAVNLDFGVTEDEVKAYFADKKVTVYNSDKTKSEDYDIDEVSVASFTKNVAGDYTATLTVKAASFTDEKAAISDKDITCDVTVTVDKYALPGDATLESNAEDLTFLKADSGQMDETALIEEFNSRGFTGTLTIEELGYSETVKIVAVSVDKPLDLTTVSDLDNDINVSTITLDVELPDGTNLDGTIDVDPVKAYVNEKLMLGDVNNDNRVNDKDWIIIFNHVNEIIEFEGLPTWADPTVYNQAVFDAADVDKSGTIDDKDWMIIFNHVSEIEEYPGLPAWED